LLLSISDITGLTIEGLLKEDVLSRQINLFDCKSRQ